MCIGVPMQVLEPFEGWALCDDDGNHRRIDMRLVGDQPAGAWVMVFIDAAREVIGEARAMQVRQALEALQAAERGESVDALFADLVGREPQLPEFLRTSPNSVQEDPES